MLDTKAQRIHGQSLPGNAGINRSEATRHILFSDPKRAHCLDTLFLLTSIRCLTRIAENSSMPPGMLEQLSYHSDPTVREAVADNPNTPLDTLWVLVKDECPKFVTPWRKTITSLFLSCVHLPKMKIRTWRAAQSQPSIAYWAEVIDTGHWRREQLAFG